jgi:hypothetical protein
MKKLLVAAIVAACIAAPSTASAKPNHRGPCQHMTMQQTIVCAENLWPVAAGVGTVLAIASRESGFYPGAISPTGTYMGIFQIGSYHMPAWPNELMSQPWFHRWFDLSYSSPGSLLNGRFSIFLGVRAMHSWGLGPWSM